MWTPGPFETKPVRAFYYITDVDPSWPAERQDEHLRDFNYGALWAISIHEVFPGHFLHYQHLRQVASKLRKSILFSSSAFVEGWAHYCEQMMVDEGFRRNDPAVRLGQLAEALIRLCRFIVGIRLHCEDMSVEQGVRFFREEAFLEETSARREAERGTFDPSYIVYSAGKLMLLKLREDYKAKAGREVLAQAIPRHAARQRHPSAVAAPRPDARARTAAQSSTDGPMPLYEYQCDACSNRFERIQKFSDPPVETCPTCGGTVRKLLSSPAIQFKGSGWYITDYAKKSSSDSGKGGDSASSTTSSDSSDTSASSSGDKGTSSGDKGTSTGGSSGSAGTGSSGSSGTGSSGS